MPQQKITQLIDAVQWTVSGDDAEAAAETRKRARLCGPECVTPRGHHRQFCIHLAAFARGEHAVGSGRVSCT
jgi:hypothetical protein